MALSFVGVTPYNDANTATFVVNVPAGVANGDLLIAMIWGYNPGAPVTPTGWTQLVAPVAVISQGTAGFYYRVASSEPASYTFNGGATWCGGTIVAYRGAATTAPGVHSSTGTSTSAADTITTTLNNAWVVNFGIGLPSTSIGMFANDTSRQTSSGPATRVVSGDRNVASAGSSASGAASLGTSANWSAFSFELDLGTATFQGASSLAGAGSLTAAATGFTPPKQGAAALAGAGALTAAGSVIAEPTVVLAGAGSLRAFGIRTGLVPPQPAPATPLTIYARDGSLTRQGQVDDFDTFSALLQWNQPDTWVLLLPATSPNLAVLTSPGGGIIVVDAHGNTVIAGPVTGWKRAWSETANTLELHGFDDSVWLERRLALPVPSGPPYTGSDADYRTGPAETVMRQYVAYNAAELANPSRQVPGLASNLAVTGGLGNPVSGVARFDVLGALLRQLAIAGGGLGFTVNPNPAGGLIFVVTAPSDKTGSVIFDPHLGNVLTFDYAVDAPKADYVIAAGSGAGAARVTAEGGDPVGVAGWGVIETLVNSSKTTPTDMAQDVTVALTSNVSPVSLAVTPIDTDGLQYGRDYQLGDAVTVMVDGTPVIGTIRQVNITLDANGQLITPTINPPDGTTGGPNDPAFFDDLRALSARIALLERRT